MIIFKQKKKTLEERKLALVNQISQLKKESITSNAQIRLLELALKEGLLYDDCSKQTD